MILSCLVLFPETTFMDIVFRCSKRRHKFVELGDLNIIELIQENVTCFFFVGCLILSIPTCFFLYLFFFFFFFFSALCTFARRHPFIKYFTVKFSCLLYFPLQSLFSLVRFNHLDISFIYLFIYGLFLLPFRFFVFIFTSFLPFLVFDLTFFVLLLTQKKKNSKKKKKKTAFEFFTHCRKSVYFDCFVWFLFCLCFFLCFVFVCFFTFYFVSL